MKKKLLFIIYCLLIICLIIPSITPLFRSDFFKMHDYTHVARLYELDKALKDGHFPVRWSKDLGWGYGMPMFNFYAPLPYYFAEIFHLIGFSFLNSIKIVFGFTFFISFLGMFLLAKKFWGTLGGFLSALAFVYSPYRSVDFYVRGALGELFAIAFIPLALWSVFELIDKKTRQLFILSGIILSFLFLSHTVLTFICIPVLILISLFYAMQSAPRIKRVAIMALSLITGIGLSSFFLIPAFFEKDFTQVEHLTKGFSYYGHHFLYFRQFLSGNWGYGGSVDGINDGMSFHLGKVHLGLVLITVIFSLIFIFKQKRLDKRNFIVILFTLLGFILAFLSTYHAKNIWDAIPLMAFIQFPWRFNSLIIVFIGFLVGGGLYYLAKVAHKKMVIILFIFAGLLLIKVNTHYFRPEGYIDPIDLYYIDEQLIRNKMSEVIPDYIPIVMKRRPHTIADKDYQILEGEAEIQVNESKTDKLFLTVNSASSSAIQLNRFYFPGWQLKVNYKLQPTEYDKAGVVQLTINKKGKFNVQLSFDDTYVRRVANVISFLCLTMILGILVWPLKDKINKSFFKKNQKVISLITLSLIIINIGSYLFQNREYLLKPYNHEEFSYLYANSQYIDPFNPKLVMVGDDLVYAYAGREYWKGIDPTKINFEHPPLGKYLIGLSILLFNNEKLIMVLIGTITLLLVFIIARQLFSNSLLALTLTLFFSLELLFKSQLSTSMLDLLQVTGILAAYYFYLIAQKKPQIFSLVGLAVGFAVSVKYGLPIAIFVSLLMIDQYFKNKKYLKYLIGSLFLSLLVFLISYWQYFAKGESLLDFLKFQNWVFHWFTGKIVTEKFLIFSTIFLGIYFFESPGKGLVLNPCWSIFWPLIFLIYISMLIIYLKNRLSPQKYFLIFFWPLTYLLFLIPGGSSEKYLILVFPFLYFVVGVFLKIFFKKYLKK